MGLVCRLGESNRTKGGRGHEGPDLSRSITVRTWAFTSSVMEELLRVTQNEEAGCGPAGLDTNWMRSSKEG